MPARKRYTRADCPAHYTCPVTDDRYYTDVYDPDHNHEFAGSEMIAARTPHNHRFAGITSEAIRRGNSHIHVIHTDDDFFLNHHHEICVKTGPAIYVGYGKHVHLVKGETSTDQGHHHDFIFATFIENPLQKGRKVYTT